MARLLPNYCLITQLLICSWNTHRAVSCLCASCLSCGLQDAGCGCLQSALRAQRSLRCR